MAKRQSLADNRSQVGEPGTLSPPGGSARQRLLAVLSATERRLLLNGVSTALLETGEGPPVVLLHGPGEYAAKWLRVIPDLSTTHHVIAPDLPGHGASEVVDGPLDTDQVLGWLEDLIVRTCPTPPALVGQILGGAIAARFAGRFGGRLSRLVLVDALGLAEFQPAPDFGRALTEFISAPTDDAHDRLWSLCAFDLDTLRSQLGDLWQSIKAYNLEAARKPSLQAAQRRLMEDFGMTAIPSGDLARISVPTTLIWGRHDLATRLPVAQAASRRHGWPLHVIENAADDPPIEQPRAFLEVLRAALGYTTGKAPASTRTAWDSIGPGYDQFVTPSHLWLAKEGLRRAGLVAGQRFLDVAAGSGALAIPAARLGAQVLAIDQSATMLEFLSTRARQEGLNIETLVMDGHALELDDNSFDMAGSQFGVMLFPDMPRAVREMARVVKPGGRVLIHAFGDPRRIDFLTFFIDAVRSIRPGFKGLPTDPPPLEFQLVAPDRLKAELLAAGLRQVTVETITESLEYRTGEELWQWLVSSNPIVERVLGMLNLSGEERDRMRQALEELVRRRRVSGDTVVLTNPVNIGVGTR